MKVSIKKNGIEKTALQMFKARGIKSVTVDDITSSMSISKKTFYNHFKSKEELLEHILNHSMTGFKQNVLILKLRHQELNQFLWISYYHLFWVRSFSLAMAHDIKKYYPDLAQIYVSFRELFIEAELRELLHDAKIKGTVRKEVDVNIFCQIQMKLVEGVVNHQLPSLLDQDQNSMFEHVVLNNLKGILNSSFKIQFELENFKLDLKEAS